jgi:hypothetical protein
MSAERYAQLSARLMDTVFHHFTVIREGSATIARRPAYYRYYTWETNAGLVLYQAQAYFTAGRQGFVITGTTANDPDRVRRDIPIIVQIVETFDPSPKAIVPARAL